MKKKYPIFYLPTAERDLNDIFEYLFRDSPKSAAAFLEKSDRLIARLGSFPLSGSLPKDPVVRRKGYRILIVESYLVFYRFEEKTVSIDRILHGKRKYDFLL